MTLLRTTNLPGKAVPLALVWLSAFLLAGCSLVKPGSEPADSSRSDAF